MVEFSLTFQTFFCSTLLVMTLVLDNLDSAAEQALLEAARLRGVKPKDLVAELLHEKFGTPAPTLHHDADFLIGTWSEEEFKEFEQAVASFNRIDTTDQR